MKQIHRIRTLAVAAGLITAMLCLPAVAAQDATLATAKKQLPKLFKGITPDDVSSTPLTDIYAVQVKHRILYVTGDGKYIFRGTLIQASNERDLTEIKENGLRLDALKVVPEGDMIVYGDKTLPHTLTVFDDVDCGYCGLLYKDLPKLNAAGVRVRFVPYPRSGPKTESWAKMEAVWCASDRQAAYQAAMDKHLDFSSPCNETAVKTGYDLGQDLGVGEMGTPMIVNENGEMIYGYRPPELMAQFAADKPAAE